MGTLANILTIIYALCCIIIIILVLLQQSDKNGASETIVGSSGSNFYEKNKGRTREGKLKTYTIIFSVIFVILTVALTILNIG